MSLEDIAMFQRKVLLFFFGDAAVAAGVVATALILAAPSGALAGTSARSVPAARQISRATGTMTDISAAHRRHYAHRGSAAGRAAYGSMVGGPVYGYPAYRGGGYAGYGYGIGDNSNSYTN
jgi:hypothetical protein